ncbi:hypothetical protein [Methylobacterium sp. WL9]|uniref:hypothetical protein n=1 Tax=Methylobacterium sp. WL9 TaxID=2603898 RepID=UPI0011CB38F5|nr:hypothetical protein [Methylobacterium sp. WL9]TXN21540.1 hypothetical protein FV217_14110 [Methylobacterium sp. WL9]
MNGGDRKTEPPFGLDMDFGEALEKFIATRPSEVEESVDRSKTKKPPGDQVPRRPARLSRAKQSASLKRET